jgi:hypothetical protein
VHNHTGLLDTGPQVPGEFRLFAFIDFEQTNVLRPEMAPPAIVDIGALTVSVLPDPFMNEDFPGYPYAPRIIAVESP